MRPSALNTLVSSGVPLPQALLELGEAEVQDELLLLAIEVGAPLSPTLQLLETELSHQERTSSELKQAQAIPQATRRLLLWLPAITLLISELSGLETIRGLTEPVGLVALLIALALLYLGARITSKMLARFAAEPPAQTRDLLALRICLSAGMGLTEVRTKLGVVSSRAQELIELSARTGAALGNLIDSEISRLNAQSFADRLTKAKKLSVSLLIPLSATTLPAFLLLTIVPMVIGIAQ